MKKLLVIALSCMIVFTSCGTADNLDDAVADKQVETQDDNNEQIAENNSSDNDDSAENEESLEFSGLDDPALLEYVEDSIYADLLGELDADEYSIEVVDAVFYPKEYIEELQFNSQENVYFGFPESELNAFFGDVRYVFTIDDSGQTIVIPLESSEPPDYGKVIEDVIIGSGVILICVTVAPVAAAAGAPAICSIFACSASGAITFAKSGAIISGATAAITTAYQTEDFEAAAKAGIKASANGFKWGAITGAVVSGGAEAIGLKIATKNGLTMNEAAIIQRESGFPIQLIKQFRSLKEYNIYKNAGLYTKVVNGKVMLVRDIDPNYVVTLKDGTKVTNLELMRSGKPPYDHITGEQFDLHHIAQNKDGSLAILTKSEHGGTNHSILHDTSKPGVHNSLTGDKNWPKKRAEFWKALAEQYT